MSGTYLVNGPSSGRRRKRFLTPFSSRSCGVDAIETHCRSGCHRGRPHRRTRSRDPRHATPHQLSSRRGVYARAGSDHRRGVVAILRSRSVGAGRAVGGRRRVRRLPANRRVRRTRAPTRASSTRSGRPARVLRRLRQPPGPSGKPPRPPRRPHGGRQGGGFRSRSSRRCGGIRRPGGADHRRQRRDRQNELRHPPLPPARVDRRLRPTGDRRRRCGGTRRHALRNVADGDARRPRCSAPT